MREGARHLEANVGRLVRAGLGGGARLDPTTGERTWRRLVADLRARRRPARFPDLVLVVLGLMLVGAGAWLAVRVTNAGGGGLTTPFVIAVAVPLILNLAVVPVAGLVILRRRWRHGLAA